MGLCGVRLGLVRLSEVGIGGVIRVRLTLVRLKVGDNRIESIGFEDVRLCGVVRDEVGSSEVERG